MALRAAYPDADPGGAFVPGGRRVLAAGAGGPLAGLTFAVKDVIDVAGLPTSAGNPDWLRTHRAPARSAPVVEALLAAGATCVGKTITDELAFSLEGVNVHYGTPINPAAPGRLPGGSSSGSAAAVAAGLADFALGTDTGGSIRVPAAFCGVVGFRPTHGRVAVAGVVPLAPSYDVVGWMARDGETLWRVGQALMGPEPAAPPARRLLARDALALCDAETAAAMRMEAMRWGAEAEIDIFAEGVDAMFECYRVLQGAEIWRSLGPWVRSATPRFGDSIRARFEDAAAISDADVARWLPVRAAVRNRLDAILADGSALIVPTAPGPALPIAAPPSAVGDFYRRALCIGAVAGHAALPQVGIPLPGLEGLPIGLSLIGGRGRDAALLSFARHMA